MQIQSSGTFVVHDKIDNIAIITESYNLAILTADINDEIVDTIKLKMVYFSDLRENLHLSPGTHNLISKEGEMGGIVENVEEVVLAVGHQEEAVAFFEELFGIEFKESWTVPADSMKVMCARIGDTQFHIVASEKPDAVIAKYIQDRGEGIHHIAFRVTNLDQLVSRLKEKGAKLVPDEPREDGNVRYIFVHPKSIYGVLVELIEYRKS